MAATFTPIVLSGSTQGRAIKLTATSIGTAQTLHTGPSVAGQFDDLELWAANTGSGLETATICNGGTTDPDDRVPVPIPPIVGPICLGRYRVPGNGTPNVLKAFVTTANVINVWAVQATHYAP